MTDRPVPWKGVFNYLEDFADAKPDAADYAMKVRMVYEVLVEDCGEAEELVDRLLFLVSAQQGRGRISKEHRDLAAKLLPKPPRRKPGRPKGALGNKAYDKRYQLYIHWISEKTLNPGLKKEQFARERCGITDKDLAGPYENDYRAKIDAVLQDLKPARMKQLDAGQRRSIETIVPLLVGYPQYLALKWREAKQRSPALTKEDFLQEFFGWPRDRKRHPMEVQMVGEFLEKLNRGEKQLADREAASERSHSSASPAKIKIARPAIPRSKRNRAR